jgi:uncharacterized iron-regulated protein
MAVPTGTPASAEQGIPVMPPIVVETDKTATLQELVAKLREERLVYVGETHTAFGDHLLQLEVLRGMAGQPQGLALGVEWFQKRFQPVLDDYLAGRIDEAEMLRGTEYYNRWRFDYRLYRPIIRFAKENGIPIIALNASRELTAEISRVGINDLPAVLRQELPDSYDVSDKAYEAILRETFDQHPSAEDGDFERFVEVQLTWDESMAQSVAEYLKANPDGRMLVLAGRGHIDGRSGIPNRVTRRTGLQGAVITTFTPSSRNFRAADYLVLAEERSLPPAGLMRVLLDEREGGVYIQGFSADSPAESAGVEEGDRILRINDVDIEHFADVKIAMIDQTPGKEVALRVARAGLLGGDKTLELKVRLAGERSSPHP